MTSPASAAPIRFDALNLAEPITQAVAALGYEEPTPIQREAIPLLLAGKDVLGQAGTGTGKTAAFSLPMLHHLITRPARTRGAVRGLVLVPTRELAMQVAEALHKYAKGSTLTVVPVFGGAPMSQQIRSLQRGADVVVATPGRALDHLRRKTLTLDALEVLVLDEADEMLDMGFAEDLETLMNATPDTRQTALFAATMAPRIAAIAERHLKSPARVHIKAEKRAPGKLPQIRQSAIIVARRQKGEALGRMLEFEAPAASIVFCRTRIEVDELTDTLKSHGYGAEALHGGMEQRQRDRVMQAFRSGRADVLVATDVAARGLDIEHISHVFNYDIPTSPEVYVHRIGRTGRIGREGVAITLVDPREQRMLRNIESLTKQKIDVVPLPSEAALRAKRLETMRDAIQERIKAGSLDDVKAFVAALAHDNDLMDIAAAVTAMLYEGGEQEEEEPQPEPARTYERERPRYDDKRGGRSEGSSDRGYSRDARGGDRGRSTGAPSRDRGPAGARPGRGPAGPMTVLYVGAGKDAGIRPADLVGAIAGEAQMNAREIGAIRVEEKHATVEVPEGMADTVIQALKATKLRGKKVEVKRHG
jgi:ATP-dependent RNA helicase DeaD